MREFHITVKSGLVPCKSEIAMDELRTEALESTVTIKRFDEVIYQSTVRHSNQDKKIDQAAIFSEIAHQLHWLSVQDPGVLSCQTVTFEKKKS